MWNAHSPYRTRRGRERGRGSNAPRRARRRPLDRFPTTRRDDDDVDARAASWAARSYVLAALRISCIRGTKADADGGVDARAIASSTESIHGSAVAASAVARLILIRCSGNVMARPWALALAFSASRGRQGTGENDGSSSEVKPQVRGCRLSIALLMTGDW